jgi:TPR repeat protein
MNDTYYIRKGIEISGPFSARTLQEMAREGKLDGVAEISTDAQHWTAASRVKGLEFIPHSARDQKSEARVCPFDVFISYSSHNQLEANAICAQLENAGIHCWIAPRNIVAGSEWGEAIVRGIEQSRIMVLVFSNFANNSPQVRREVERAISKELFLIPFRIENVHPARSLEYALSNTHWMDAFDPPLEKHIKKLRTLIVRLLNEQSSGASDLGGNPLRLADEDSRSARIPPPGRFRRWLTISISVVLLPVLMVFAYRSVGHKDMRSNAPATAAADGELRFMIETDAAECTRYRLLGKSPEGYLKQVVESHAAGWKSGASEGEAQADALLGACDEMGVGGAQNYPSAVDHYRRASKGGSAWGTMGLAGMYANGRGVAQDFKEAARLFKQAADAGDANAMDIYAEMESNGIGVDVDTASSAEWYHKAALGGYIPAYVREGLRCEDAKNYEQAMSWYRKASDVGNTSAMVQISRMYGMGLGVPVNRDECMKWLRYAVNAGDQRAAEVLKVFEKTDEKQDPLQERLNEDLKELTCDSQPFEKVLNFLKDVGGLNIVVQWDQLATVDIRPDTPISLQLKNVPFRKALASVLLQADKGKNLLTFTAEDSVITIVLTRHN